LGNACRDFVKQVKEIRENEYAQYLSAVRGAVSEALEDLGLGNEVGALALQAALEREMEVKIREVEFLDEFLDHQISGMPKEFYLEALVHGVETLLQEFSRRELLIAMREIQDQELRRRGEKMWRAILRSGELHFLFMDVDVRPWRHDMPSNAEIQRTLEHAGLSPDNTIVAAWRRRGGTEEYALVICGNIGRPEALPMLPPCPGKSKRSIRVRLYLHDVRRVPKEKLSLSARSAGLQGLYKYQHFSACLGKTRSELLEGLWYWNKSMTSKYFGCWLRECWKRLREKGSLTEKEAKRISDGLAKEIGQAERRSLELLRSTVGSEAADQFLKLGHLIVDSANGRKYRITHDGEVFDVATGRSVCVMVDDEGELPLYDDILAKYLVIRDHPEQIETLEPEENEFREVPGNLLKEICARAGIGMGELLERINRTQADLAYQVTRLGAVLLVARELGVEFGP